MPEKVIQVDVAGAAPAYERIVNAVRMMLVSGAFQPGDQLPTVRQLAMDLGVHHNTVAEAYRLLAQEGWLDLKRGRGATVLMRPYPSPTPEAQSQFARSLDELVAKARAAGLPQGAIAEYLDSLVTRLRSGGGK